MATSNPIAQTPGPALKVPQITARRRGRPTSSEMEERDAQLMAVATSLFFQQGYGATTMAQVARIARISKTTLYARFPSKAALFRGIVSAEVDQLNAAAAEGLNEAKTLYDALYAIGQGSLLMGHDPNFIQLTRLTYGESGRFPELGEAAVARRKEGVQAIAGTIRTFAEKDGIACTDPIGAAEIFITLIVGWSTVAMVEDEHSVSRDDEATLRKAVKFFLASRAEW